MDSINKILLDRIQRSFPLTADPFRGLSQGLGVSEAQVRERLAMLKAQGLIRQISAIFNTGAMGYRSSLVAMAVPEERIETAAAAVNRYQGVSHNYLRSDAYNLWFTIAVPPGTTLERKVGELSEAAGGWPTLILPALRKYKLAVVLDVLDEGEASPASSERSVVPPSESFALFEPTTENVSVARCIQEDLPLVERPFKVWAETLGLTEDRLLEQVGEWKDRGLVRRFAAVLNHRRVGFGANGMVVWTCPEDRIDDYGRLLAAHAEVSHCYYRPAHPVWPYNLYAMVHARTEEDCRRVAFKMAERIGIHDHRILFSTREFKKIRLKLFWD